jgi:hypothetical protein
MWPKPPTRFLRNLAAKRQPFSYPTCNAAGASDGKEMAQSHMAKSARIAELNLDTARIPEQPSLTIPGTGEEKSP